jgi:hypothetical protein
VFGVVETTGLDANDTASTSATFHVIHQILGVQLADVNLKKLWAFREYSFESPAFVCTTILPIDTFEWNISGPFSLVAFSASCIFNFNSI